MGDIESLKNTGILALNMPSSPHTTKTVVVLGVARSGTTMVASVLQTLGVFMGERLGPVLEDVILSQAIESRDYKCLNEIVKLRNADHPIWGWKRPSAIDHSEVWQGCFRNPHLIAILRDPFAIANRNRISMLSDIFQNMEDSIKRLGTLVKFLCQQKNPILLCSYEKVLSSPEAFVRAVDDFLGLSANARWDEAVRQINPAPLEYLENSRITQSVGHLEIANERICCGWAFYRHQPSKPVRIQIFVNQRHLQTVDARMHRPDVKDTKAHPTGMCGFKFEWADDLRPKIGDLVEAHLEGDVRPLMGSPKPIVAAAPRRVSKGSRLRGCSPSFYCIGAQQAGTTWIFETLKNHPQIYLPSCKGVHYWDVHNDRPLRWYRNHFKPGWINGDITPAYAVLPSSRILEIKRLTPKANVLFSMRNPVERGWSYVQVAARRRFSTALDALKSGDPDGEILSFIRHHLFDPKRLDRNDYANTIRRWRGVFGNRALMWFKYERMSLDPRGLLVDICRHIGADPAWVDGLPINTMDRRVSEPDKFPFPPALRAEYADRCAPFIDDLENLLGERFDDWRD